MTQSKHCHTTLVLKNPALLTGRLDLLHVPRRERKGKDICVSAPI